MRLYQFAADGSSLIPWHSTPLGGAIPAALAGFMGKLLVGCGKSLRLMECGRQRLLRKCEFQGLPNLVTSIFTQGYRVYVGDSHESFHFMRYRKHDNSFYIFADDFTPRCALLHFLPCAVLLCVSLSYSGIRDGNVDLFHVAKLSVPRPA